MADRRALWDKTIAEELDELNNPGTSTGVPNVKQQPDLVGGGYNF